MISRASTALLGKGESYSTIGDQVRDGIFTPFLGAGASSLRQAPLNVQEEPWATIWNAILAIKGGLEKPSYRDYLWSFAMLHLRLKKTDPCLSLLKKAFEAPVVSPSPIWPPRTLLEFQQAVVRLATELGILFGHQFASAFQALDCFNNFRIEIDPSSPASKEFLNKMLAAVSAASQLPEKAHPAYLMDSTVTPNLRSEAMYERLLILAFGVLNEQVARKRWIQKWLNIHARRTELLPSEKKVITRLSKTTLHAEILEWLPDLLWYTLRFWSPCLPTTAEMAFDLSLHPSYVPPRRADLAQAAEAAWSEKLPCEIRDWFAFCHAHTPKATRFHVAVASVLQHSYDLYARAEAEDDETENDEVTGSGYSVIPRSSEGENANGKEPDRKLPVAFTTNFDCSLEKVFDKLQMSYHVVYPLRWAAKRSSLKVTESNNRAVQWYIIDSCRQSRLPKLCEKAPRNLRGPIIVKLHGSPLDPLPPDFEHWLVLSEGGYLEALASPLPPWLQNELNGSRDRSLWFLGYSISDWNIRLRLYEHVRHGKEGSAEVSKSVVNRQPDAFTTAILRALGVQVYEGDLEELANALIAGLKILPKSETSKYVKELMALLGE